MTILLREDDVVKLTALSGNIDKDQLIPFVKTAQKNEIRRILGMELYTKIVDDYDDDTLSGVYLIIYEEFVVDMLTYFAAADYIQMGIYKINNGGIFKATAENGTPVEIAEINILSGNYKSLGYATEKLFIDFMCKQNVVEYNGNDDSNLGMPWYSSLN